MSNYSNRPPDEGRDGEVMPEGITTKALGKGEIVLNFGTVYRIPDIAEMLGISFRQVQAHIDDGSLVAVNVGRGGERRDLRVLERDLEGFMTRRRVGVSGSAPVSVRRRKSRTNNVVEVDGYAARRAARIALKENSDAR